MELSTYRGRLEAHARRLGETRESAEDLAQDALIRAHRNPPDPERSVEGYLLKIVTNLVTDARRLRRRRPALAPWELAKDTIEETVAVPGPGEPGGEDAPVVSDEARALFAALVRTLPEELRVPVLMTAAGRTYREVAAEMAIPVGTVRSRLHRARRTMRGQLASVRGAAFLG